MDIFQNIPQLPQTGLIIAILTAWTLIAKGVALWHASQNKQKQWFIAILILNTVGVLEIAYLFAFAKNKLQIEDITRYLKNINIKPTHK